MSFSGEVKKELCQVALENTNECCKLAECYGALLMGKAFSSREIVFSTEYDCVSEHVYSLLQDCLGEQLFEKEKSKSKYKLVISGAEKVKKVYDFFGHEKRQLNLRINRGNFSDDCCLSAFLRGAFLACGTVTDPNKNYHLEFVVPFLKLSQDFFRIIEESGIVAKTVVRKGSNVIYIKDSENIEDMLTLIGAQLSSLELMSIKIQKDMRNKVNRKVNFEYANIERSVKAGMAQVEAIELIIKRQGLDTLPEEYKELALLRLDNPDMSLKQLGESLSTPLSRSGVKHRLDKILEIAAKLKK